MFPLIGMGSNAGNIAFPAQRMLKEMWRVSKREDHIFETGVADLPPVARSCARMVQCSSSRCAWMSCTPSFHDRFFIFAMWNIGLLQCRIFSQYGKLNFALKYERCKLLIKNRKINDLYKT
jgi:hypothetical protein